METQVVVVVVVEVDGGKMERGIILLTKYKELVMGV